MRTAIANQGEIRIDRMDAIDYETKPFTEKLGESFLISHSEQGHHHLLDGDVTVMERVDAPAGMRILKAIVHSPAKLWQDAPAPHEPINLAPGLYEFRLKREYDPFTEKARRVAD